MTQNDDFFTPTFYALVYVKRKDSREKFSENIYIIIII